MERLLAILFSVMLLIATAPPKMTGGGCSFSGGICTPKENCTPDSSEASCALHQEEDEGSKQPVCPMPACCVCGPCCCLCVVPERPVLPFAFWPDEIRTNPATYRAFLPQQVWLTVWKPPAFSV